MLPKLRPSNAGPLSCTSKRMTSAWADSENRTDAPSAAMRNLVIGGDPSFRRSEPLSRRRNTCCAGFLRPVRQGPVRPDEVTGVSVRIFLQIVLMLGLGFPERSDRCQLG